MFHLVEVCGRLLSLPPHKFPLQYISQNEALLLLSFMPEVDCVVCGFY